jgi:hypothetical protein
VNIEDTEEEKKCAAEAALEDQGEARRGAWGLEGVGEDITPTPTTTRTTTAATEATGAAAATDTERRLRRRGDRRMGDEGGEEKNQDETEAFSLYFHQ